MNGKAQLEVPHGRVRASRTRLSVMQADAMRSTRAALEQRISERRDVAAVWLVACRIHTRRPFKSCFASETGCFPSQNRCLTGCRTF